MSRYTAAGAVAAEDNDDEEYDYSGVNAARGDRDFMRRNFSQFSTIHHSLLSKFYNTTTCERHYQQPHYNSLINIRYPMFDKLNPATGVCAHFLRRGYTKPIKYQLNTAVWSADGRWLVLGTQSGDFALWEGEQLKVHKVVSVPAHKILTDGGKVQDYVPITAMAWNHHGNSLVSGDEKGVIQYSDESFRSNYVVREAHTGAVRGLSYSPFDSKIASCSDDSKVKIWTVGVDHPDMTLTGHGSDVRCIDWHPYRSLIASGSRESVIKLWDPKQSSCVSNITSHKKSVQCLHWNQNGNWLASGGKDGLVKIFDIRVMREMENLRGHNADVTSLQWHPHFEALLLSGGYNGSLIYWLADTNQHAHTAIGDAHRQSVDVICWHPGGHLVATASHDSILKFWCREAAGSKIDGKSTQEFTEMQPPVYGYGPLPSETIPSVILQCSSVQQAQQAALAQTSNATQQATQSSTTAAPSTSRYFQQGGTKYTPRPTAGGFQGRSYYSGRGDATAGRKRQREG